MITPKSKHLKMLHNGGNVLHSSTSTHIVLLVLLVAIDIENARRKDMSVANLVKKYENGTEKFLT